MKRTRVVLLMYLTTAGLAGAQTNWPSFRGPEASGIAHDAATPTNWNAKKGENILWTTAIPGLGHSSPVIWGERLFVTTAVNQKKAAPLKVGLYGDPESAADDDAQQWRVLCLNKTSGEILWQNIAHEGKPRMRRHPKATHANCTMATDGTNVVAFFGSEGLYCYDLAGHPRWQKDLGVLRASPIVYNDAIDTKGESLEWGFASSPVIYGGRVFVQCDVLSNGFVAAYDVATGERSGGRGAMTRRRGARLKYAPRGRGRNWSSTAGSTWAATICRRGRRFGGCPAGAIARCRRQWCGMALIFLMSAHGPRSPIYAVRSDAVGDVSLRNGASTNEHVAWSMLRGASYMQTPLIYGSNLFTCHITGILSCFEAATGKPWYKERLGSGGDGFTASPVAGEDRLYFTSEQGSVYVVKPGTNFTVLATNEMGEVCMATPAISEGTIYFRTQEHVVAVGTRK